MAGEKTTGTESASARVSTSGKATFNVEVKSEAEIIVEAKRRVEQAKKGWKKITAAIGERFGAKASDSTDASADKTTTATDSAPATVEAAPTAPTSAPPAPAPASGTPAPISGYEQFKEWVSKNAPEDAAKLVNDSSDAVKNFFNENVLTFDEKGNLDLTPLQANLRGASEQVQNTLNPLFKKLQESGRAVYNVTAPAAETGAAAVTNFMGQNASSMMGAIFGIGGIIAGGGGIEGLLIGAVMALIGAMFGPSLMEFMAPGSTSPMQMLAEDKTAPEKGRDHVKALMQGSGHELQEKQQVLLMETKARGGTRHLHVVGEKVGDQKFRIDHVISDNASGEPPRIHTFTNGIGPDGKFMGDSCRTFDLLNRTGPGTEGMAYFPNEQAAIIMNMVNYELSENSPDKTGVDKKKIQDDRKNFRHKAKVAFMVDSQELKDNASAKGGATGSGFAPDAVTPAEPKPTAAKGETVDFAKILRDAAANTQNLNSEDYGALAEFVNKRLPEGQKISNISDVNAIAQGMDKITKNLTPQQRKEIAEFAKSDDQFTAEEIEKMSIIVPPPPTRETKRDSTAAR